MADGTTDPKATQVIVTEQFEVCRQYASEQISSAETYLDTLITYAYESPYQVDSASVSYDWPSPEESIPDDYASLLALRPDAPSTALLTIDPPSALYTPDLNEVTVYTEDDIPDMPTYQGSDAPVLSFMDAPDPTLPESPGDAPTLTDPETFLPTAPDKTLPAVPVLTDVTIPSPPELSIVTFDETAPENTLVPPTSAFSYAESPYYSELSDALEAKLLYDVENGGTGLGATIEADIWARARDRQALVNSRKYEEALSFWAARGFTLPPGQLAAAIREAMADQTRGDEQINYEIAIEQARLAQNNTQFTVGQASQFVQQDMAHTDQVANRAFETAKAVVQYSIDIYNAQVTNYQAQLETYKTAASVYEIKIRADMAKVETYRAQMEGAKVSLDVQRMNFDLYKAQLDGLNILVNIYATEMQAANLRAEMEKLRLDGFRAEIDAYIAQVNAKTAEYNMYQAQVNGEMTRVQAYSEEVKSYAVSVEAWKTYIDGLKSSVELQMLPNDNELKILQVDIERYKADLAQSTAEVDAILKAYGTDVEAYKADVSAYNAELEGAIKIYEGRIEQAKNETDLLLKNAELNLQSYITQRNLAFEAAKAGAQISSQIAASALTGVNANASTQFQGQVSEDKNWDMTQSTPTYTHSYRYECDCGA